MNDSHFLHFYSTEKKIHGLTKNVIAPYWIGYDGSADCRGTHENFFFMLIGSMPWVLLLLPATPTPPPSSPFQAASSTLSWQRSHCCRCCCQVEGEEVEKYDFVCLRRVRRSCRKELGSSKCNLQAEWYSSKIVPQFFAINECFFFFEILARHFPALDGLH